ncbi:MAG: leucine-rich repeat protein [Treponema sp.]|jgi:hypothetical protein|nr:leucine-rich repeat protein [Treponema sp.]
MNCAWCGKGIWSGDSYYTYDNRVYCSEKCYYDAHPEENLQAIDAEARAKRDAENSRDKEHFRPFIEKRMGRPVRLDEIEWHPRLKTWVAEEELQAEQRAARQALEAAIKCDNISIGFDMYWDVSDELWGFTCVLSWRGGDVSNYLWLTPQDAAYAVTLCEYLGKSLNDIDWTGFGGDIDWTGFGLDSGAQGIADLRQADAKWRAWLDSLKHKKVGKGYSKFGGVRSGRKAEVDYDSGQKKWGVWYIERTMKPFSNVLIDKDQFWDATPYITRIPVDFSRFPGKGQYSFDFARWDAYFNGKGSMSAPAATNAAPAAKPAPVTTKAAPPEFDIKNGVLVKYSGKGGKVTIPKNVTEIGEEAFDNSCCHSGLTAVEIPEGVTSIGDAAFFECENLATVTFPASLRSIGENAFQMCYALVSVHIPDGVQTIGRMAFYECSLEKISLPEGVELDEDAFEENPGIPVYRSAKAAAKPAPAAPSAKPRFCGECGAKIDGPAKFCPECGTKQ